jgi:hypothetical protein
VLTVAIFYTNSAHLFVCHKLASRAAFPVARVAASGPVAARIVARNIHVTPIALGKSVELLCCESIEFIDRFLLLSARNRNVFSKALDEEIKDATAEDVVVPTEFRDFKVLCNLAISLYFISRTRLPTHAMFQIVVNGPEALFERTQNDET